ncbi:unnamed protein product [Clonostachys rosea]|uniref:Uncharacterized protein n=1 Tax=Bionectria ochroleuca TaxID=29856 RepID=A0ABY6ULG6_BIOOC|nr:unnamed protein product [Clonostachys rosea]
MTRQSKGVTSTPFLSQRFAYKHTILASQQQLWTLFHQDTMVKQKKDTCIRFDCRRSQDVLDSAMNYLQAARESLHGAEGNINELKTGHQEGGIDEEWAAEASVAGNINDLAKACILMFERIQHSQEENDGSRGLEISGIFLKAFKIWAFTSGASHPDAFKLEPGKMVRGWSRNDGGPIYKAIRDVLRQQYHTLGAALLARERGSLTSETIAEIEALLSELDFVTFSDPMGYGPLVSKDEFDKKIRCLVQEEKVDDLSIIGRPDFWESYVDHYPSDDRCQNFDEMFRKVSSADDQLAKRRDIQERLICNNSVRRDQILEGMPFSSHDTHRKRHDSFSLFLSPEGDILDGVTMKRLPYARDFF